MDFTPGRPLRAYSITGTWTDFSTDDLVGNDMNRFKNWKCGAGSQNLSVNMDGKVFSATCHVGGCYGNIYSEFKIPDNWVTCPMERCTCGADLFIPKYNTNPERLRKTFGLPTEPEKRIPSRFSDFDGLERTHFSKHKQVYWEIGRRCNFSCSYCKPTHHSKTDAHRTIDELMDATERLFKQFARGEVVNFIISGGEPTVNPALMDWVKYLHKNGHHISIHTNGSRNADYYGELIHYTDINLSVHFEFWNQKKMFDNISRIVEEKRRVHNVNVGHLEVKIMMPPHQYQTTLLFEDSLRGIEGFKDLCTWAIVPIRGGDRLEQVVEGYEPAHFEMFGDRR